MLFLYSGFNENTFEDFKSFTQGLKEDGTIALLLQGGHGFEKYLANYLAPFENSCKSKICVIAPNENEQFISDSGIAILKAASAIFIGGGDTEKYRQLYCMPAIKKILKEKHIAGTPIAGLSAGSILMNSEVYNEETKSFSDGLGLVDNIFFFPHFEEDNYAYRLITFLEINAGKTAYGLENCSYLRIDNSGGIKSYGSGKAYVCKYDKNEISIRRLS